MSFTYININWSRIITECSIKEFNKITTSPGKRKKHTLYYFIIVSSGFGLFPSSGLHCKMIKIINTRLQ